MKSAYLCILFLLLLPLIAHGFAISPPQDFKKIDGGGSWEGEIIVIGTEDERIIVNTPKEVRVNPTHFSIKKGEVKTIDFSAQIPHKNGHVKYNLSFESENAGEGITLQKRIIIPLAYTAKKEQILPLIQSSKLTLISSLEKTRDVLPLASFFFLLLLTLVLVGVRYLYKRKQRY